MLHATVLSAGLPRGALYEGPYWSATRCSLWWVDIAGKEVFSRDQASGLIKRFQMPEKVSAVVETRDGRLLVTGQRRLWVLDPDTGATTTAFELSEEPETNRCNDAKCDPAGNLWFGTMDDSEQGSTGALWCLTVSGQLLHFFGDVGVSNTLAWDLARSRMYFADSKIGTIFVMNFRLVDGIPELGPRQVFAGPDIAPGVPDGSALDVEGNLWNARWDGECVVRIDPEGRVRHLLKVGAKRPTSCAFAGDDLENLIVTTATIGLADIHADAVDGHVLSFSTGLLGQPVAAYGGVVSGRSVSEAA